MNGTLPSTWCWSLSPLQVCWSITKCFALSLLCPSPEVAKPAQTGTILSGEQVCLLFVGYGFPQGIDMEPFWKIKIKNPHMCTEEMSPSALQRVCPSRQETQVEPSFLRMGVPREVCHVPGVRCLDSPWFVLSHTDVVAERKAGRCERRRPFLNCLQKPSWISQNQVHPRGVLKMWAKAHFMPW